MSNLKLWDAVKTVDIKYTKTSSPGGRKQTSISGVYPIYMMTKAIGKMGELWKFEIKEERLDNTQPIILKGEILRDGNNIIWEQTHTVKMALLMRNDKSEEWENVCEQFGHTKYRYLASRGKPSEYIAVDEEAPKKSVTDAQKKCLSLIGVCADVYMGDIDDRDYMNQVQDELRIERADSDDLATREEIELIKKELDDSIKAIGLCPDSRSANLAMRQKLKFFNNRISSNKLSVPARYAIDEIEKALKSKAIKEEDSKND